MRDQARIENALQAWLLMLITGLAVPGRDWGIRNAIFPKQDSASTTSSESVTFTSCVHEPDTDTKTNS